jgi:hypothetical protein
LDAGLPINARLMILRMIHLVILVMVMIEARKMTHHLKLRSLLVVVLLAVFPVVEGIAPRLIVPMILLKNAWPVDLP